VIPPRLAQLEEINFTFLSHTRLTLSLISLVVRKSEMSSKKPDRRLHLSLDRKY
jgi:hypothetical protein